MTGKYSISVNGWWNKYIGEVEADDEAQAVEKAENELDTCNPMICHQCAGEVEIGDTVNVYAECEDGK